MLFPVKYYRSGSNQCQSLCIKSELLWNISMLKLFPPKLCCLETSTSISDMYINSKSISIYWCALPMAIGFGTIYIKQSMYMHLDDIMTCSSWAGISPFLQERYKVKANTCTLTSIWWNSVFSSSFNV